MLCKTSDLQCASLFGLEVAAGVQQKRRVYSSEASRTDLCVLGVLFYSFPNCDQRLPLSGHNLCLKFPGKKLLAFCAFPSLPFRSSCSPSADLPAASNFPGRRFCKSLVLGRGVRPARSARWRSWMRTKAIGLPITPLALFSFSWFPT